MKNAQLAGRLRGIAAQKPTDIWRELHALAMELEIGPAITLPRPAPRPAPVKLDVDPDPEPVVASRPKPIASLAEVEIPTDDLEAFARAVQPVRGPGLIASLLTWRRR